MRRAELDELAQVLLVFGAGPAIVLIHIEILLQQHRGRLHRRRRGREMVAVLQHQGGQQTDDQDGNAPFRRWRPATPRR